MSFEVYHPRTRATTKAKSMVVRLSKNSIVLNKVAREQLNAPEVELAFDEDANTIRIKPSIDGGSAIKKTKVVASGFFKHFEVSATGAYPAEYNQEENALYVKLA
jgi:hypothetical protein